MKKEEKEKEREDMKHQDEDTSFDYWKFVGHIGQGCH